MARKFGVSIPVRPFRVSVPVLALLSAVIVSGVLTVKNPCCNSLCGDIVQEKRRVSKENNSECAFLRPQGLSRTTLSIYELIKGKEKSINQSTHACPMILPILILSCFPRKVLALVLIEL
jgi:hypothetical protein